VEIDADEPDTRERLVRAAIEVFLEKGYGGTRVQDIAKRAGYTPGALYVHFPSRSALLGEAIVVEGQRIVSQLAESFSTVVPGGDAAAQAMANFAVVESGAVDQLMLEALALAARDPAARSMLAEQFGSLAERMTHQVEIGIEMGIVDPALDVGAVRTFFSAWILGLVVHRAIGLAAADPEAMSEVCSRMIGALAPR
jgi:AcrR family transcriptional regulator